jgi:hypothetical protein
MANPRRGEVSCRLGGRRHTLRLTLNALAEIEAAMAADGLAGLGQRLAAGRLRSADLVALLGATLRGGGTAVSDEEAGALVDAGDLPVIAEALARLFALAFPEAEETARPSPARR